MDYTLNVPSIEEISFKLTENLISSNAHIPRSRLLDDSLDYTLSRASIQYLLHEEEDEQPSSLPPQLGQSGFWKQSCLKTTCAGTTEPSSIRKTSKTFFRQRIVSSNKSSEKGSLTRRLSQHVMSLGDELLEQKKGLKPLHTPHPAPFRSTDQKKRTASGKHIKPLQKTPEIELLALHSSMKVKPVALENHSVREKIYMRRKMQNRGSVIHAIEEFSQCAPALTERKSYRIR